MKNATKVTSSFFVAFWIAVLKGSKGFKYAILRIFDCYLVDGCLIDSHTLSPIFIFESLKGLRIIMTE